jgi:hypothetical protein
MLCPLAGIAQISGPATASVGAPVTFTADSPDASGLLGVTYSWNFRPMNLHPAFTPVGVPSNAAVTLSTSTGNLYMASSMVMDKGNYFMFMNTSTGVIRLAFGTDPANTPTVTQVLTTSGQINGGIEVVKDDVTGKWYVVRTRNGSGGTDGEVTVMDFDTDLTNTPVVKTAMVPNAYETRHLSVVKWKGEWIAFGIGWRVVRINFGATLDPATATAIELPTTVTAVSNAWFGALTQESGNWYMVLLSYTPAVMYRLEFGTNLNNNSPTLVSLTVPSMDISRGFTLARTCDQLYGMVQQENGTVVKLDFAGTVTSNTLTSAGTYTPWGPLSAFSHSVGYVHNDTFCLLSNNWYKDIYRAKMIPLVAEQHKYYNRSATHTFTAPGTYEVTLAINQGGKMATSAYCHTVTVSAAPAQPGLFTTAKNPVCRGESGVTYTVPAVSGATSYQWDYTGGTGVTLGGTTTSGPSNTLNFSTSATSGTLRVRAVSSGGQSAWRDTAITVNVLPTAVITTPGGVTAICQGDSLLMTATAVPGATYQWKQGGANVGTNATTYYAKTAAGYTVTVTDPVTSCAATSATTTLTVNARPTAAVTPSGNQAICAGDSLQLTATTVSGANYQWKRGTTNVGTNATTYYAKEAGNYTVTVTNPSTNCAATSSATVVTVNPLPTAVITTPGGVTSICQGDSLQLTATAVSGASYQWKLGGVNIGTNATTYHASVPGNYTVTVTNTATNCSATSAAKTVDVHSLPTATVTAGGPTILCAGDSVVLTAGAGTGYSYQWKNGTTNVGNGSATYAAHTTGSYKVVVTDGGTGCKDSTQEVEVTVFTRPAVMLGPGDTAFCEGGVVTLEVSSQDTGLTYRWKDGQSTIPLATAYFLEITETGTYTVVVGRSAVAGCEDTTNEVAVTVHPLPVADLTWDGATIHATGGYMSYQWNTGSQPIAGATDSTFQPSANGGYSVTVVDANGCTSTSPVYNVTLGVGELGSGPATVRIYPNPFTDQVYAEVPEGARLILRNLEGRLLQQQTGSGMIDMRGYPSGMYMLRIMDKDGALIGNEKLLKQ